MPNSQVTALHSMEPGMEGTWMGVIIASVLQAILTFHKMDDLAKSSYSSGMSGWQKECHPLFIFLVLANEYIYLGAR